MNSEKKIAIIGLGYVGLPLAVEFGKKRKTVGYDTNESRIKELKSGNDTTLEVTKSDLANASHLNFTCDSNDFHFGEELSHFSNGLKAFHIGHDNVSYNSSWFKVFY